MIFLYTEDLYLLQYETLTLQKFSLRFILMFIIIIVCNSRVLLVFILKPVIFNSTVLIERPNISASTIL